MAEYIEREAAIKRFTFATLDCLGMEPMIRSADVVAALKSIPAADVVPVVRCKDCKHSAVDFEDRRYCKFVTYYNHVPDDWFCADGERNGGDGE